MSINNDGQYVPANPEYSGPDAAHYSPAGGFGGPGDPNQTPEPRKPRSPWIAVAIATAAVVCIGGLGTAAVAELTSVSSSSSTSATPNINTGRGGTFGQGGGQFQNGGQSIGQQATAGESPATASTSAQKVGIVTINTVLDYTKDEQAAGTGMILSANGYILTNNHVIADSTSVTVTVESTNKTYRAVVVGSNSTEDVAVLKLVDASGLTPITFDASATVSVGQSVYSTGNAEGTGNLVTAVGTVGAVDQTLTIGSDDADSTETLSGMIQLESDVVSGDSGGPLFNTSGKVIGMITAASSGTSPITGDAINIAKVLKVVDQIESGAKSSEIVYGTPSFAGISISKTTSTRGVVVESTFPGLPAAAAGIGAGDVITSVDGASVTTAEGLSAKIHSYAVGTQVKIAWIDTLGKVHVSLVTLVAGPAS